MLGLNLRQSAPLVINPATGACHLVCGMWKSLNMPLPSGACLTDEGVQNTSCKEAMAPFRCFQNDRGRRFVRLQQSMRPAVRQHAFVHTMQT